MILSVQQIKFDILAYIKEFDSRFESWYIGISSDPLNTMVMEHDVDLDENIWLFRQAVSFNACRNIQRYFISTLNTDGNPVEHGDQDMDCIYLFKKASNTRPLAHSAAEDRVSV